jgi:prepilin-type N-terminal cleavage/methylation domain-containing protein
LGLASRVFRARLSLSPRRAGYTILELVIVVTITGLLLSIAIPRTQRTLDRISVRAAASDIVATLNSARTLALASYAAVAVHMDSATGTLRVRRGSDLLLSRDIGQAHGVRIAPTRDSLAYDARGLGRGAANLSIVISRRSVAETVFVSRLGRVR